MQVAAYRACQLTRRLDLLCLRQLAREREFNLVIESGVCPLTNIR